MSRLEYAKLFFLGKKSSCMLDIEKRFPWGEGFRRSVSFFFTFGNIGFDFKWGWLIILPARCAFDYQNNESVFYLSTPLFSVYYNKPEIHNSEGVKEC